MSRPDSSAPRRRPTIVDVARRAGVSAAAVSFAVNDRPGVASGTRERILAAARELGWQPSATVETRHAEGIGPAVAHLAALGHERIAFLGGRAELEHVRIREAAWREA